ncbi:MAG: pyruvate, phosphate dikinase [Candidatus Iainarchaeum archaeon]|uniref:pyruvate, phosphate dikinase n=1 Tax=Candidatus Iainarchaeum sp. TaxID=3101447 RepID=A0A497JGD7_9ARCH|nr:MAG: pyruvate, phosphate dikinase [Candidatus Diapherotrites archaeon]
MQRRVLDFGESTDKYLVGGKGAQLSRMIQIGLRVPPGFTITTKACIEYYKRGRQIDEELWQEVLEHLKKLEEKMQRKFGDAERPLLVSARSGAYVSMPGMMDTVLNIGLNDETVKGFAKMTNERTAYDCYRRLLQMFGDVVLGVKHEKFEKILQEEKQKEGVKFDYELNVEALKRIIERYKELIKNEGKEFPQDVFQQLKLAIKAVFESWNNARAIAYRKIHKIPDDAGTAVNIQAMVFGNLNERSGTGVAFTRNPATGEKEYYGEFLQNAQGEDVVAGIRTPVPISKIKEIMPEVYEELLKVYEILEKELKDMQDFEFTIEDGKLYLLQTRNGKRTAKAAVKIAVDMVKEGLISKEEAIKRIEAAQLKQLLHKRFSEASKKSAKLLAKGLAASPGAAIGKIAFTAEEVVRLKEVDAGEKVILVRPETSPEDIEGMHLAEGILTQRGGLTSHAAVVARGMGKCCVVGCEALHIDEEKEEILVNGVKLKKGDVISIDGSTGEVYLGFLEVEEPKMFDEFKELMQWVDEFRKIKVRTNADLPKDAELARNFGAEGIGLCRTEHMFFAEDRINVMRAMILAESKEERKKALEKLLPMQKEDFLGIFKAMDGLPVTIRLLDPPLHEFLPKEEKEIEAVAKELNVSAEEIKKKAEMLKEMNPMLGHRGCRLGISFPEIYEMQIKAILMAAKEAREKGINAKPEIEVPLVAIAEELKIIREMVEEIKKELNIDFEVKVGTMVELPRACVTADEIAKYADFMSFGTNDLTQTTFGFSRDDVGKFLPIYLEKKILKEDPFARIDEKGVGKLMKMCIELARKANPNIEIGICGEQGGEAKSVKFCHKIGLDYVSCSPYRVPIARLAAAQAAIEK